MQAVADANLELLNAGEHVELGDVDGVVSVEACSILDHLDVKPATPAWPSCGRAVLVTHVEEVLTNGVAELSGKWTCANARGVCLDHTNDAPNLARRKAESRAHTTHSGGGGGDEGEGAKVNVEEGRVGALDEEARVFLDLLVHEGEGIHDLRRKKLGVLHVPLDLIFLVVVGESTGIVLGLEAVEVAHFGGQGVRVQQIRKADAVAIHLGGVARSDTTLRRAERASG
mmetsp:Transcript_13782/g.36960  ORF Transcript_13782/g.36960 Transcript_13782/m.36960 type:complete len:228 (+) Transcript_13782:483-1166(+)